MNDRLHPLRATLHPAFLVTVALLLVNDHILKDSAAAGLLTGKLSDFAGLFFAPILLAALLGVRTRRGLHGAAAAVAIVFAAINLSPTLAAMWDTAASYVYPFQTTVDPTDLVALVSIPFGLWVLEPAMRSERSMSLRRLAEYAAVTVAAMGSVATSPPPCHDCEWPEESWPESSEITIFNATNELQVVRVRQLRTSVEIDCAVVADDPAALLADELFGPVTTWQLLSGQQMPLNWRRPGVDDTDCGAALIESDTVGDAVVFFTGELQWKEYRFDDPEAEPDGPDADQTIVIRADYGETPTEEMNPWQNRNECGARADLCDTETLAPLAEIPTGARYSYESVNPEPLHFERSNVAEGTLAERPEECRMPAEEAKLVWSELPNPAHDKVIEVVEQTDGCHTIVLAAEFVDPADEKSLETRDWILCAPIDSVSWLAGEGRWEIEVNDVSDPQAIEGGYDGFEIVARPADPERQLESRTVHVFRGYAAPPSLVDLGFGAQIRPDCGVYDLACGQLGVPIDVTLEQYGDVLTPGDARSYGQVFPVELHLVRAEYRPVRDADCEQTDGGWRRPQSSSEDVDGYFEAVVITR